MFQVGEERLLAVAHVLRHDLCATDCSSYLRSAHQQVAGRCTRLEPLPAGRISAQVGSPAMPGLLVEIVVHRGPVPSVDTDDSLLARPKGFEPLTS